MSINQENLTKIIAEAINRIENMPYVQVGVSNRHVHLSSEDLEILFGTGYQLTHIKDLMQPGQYACAETVTIKGSKGAIEGVRILGPVRAASQVEISFTDGFKLGVAAPVRESGKLQDAQEITIENPKTGAKITRTSAIAALRHVHLSEEYAEKYGLRDKQMVSVEFTTERGLVFNNVLLRVSKDFVPEMHLDTDEANSGGIQNGDYGRIIP